MDGRLSSFCHANPQDQTMDRIGFGRLVPASDLSDPYRYRIVLRSSDRSSVRSPDRSPAYFTEWSSDLFVERTLDRPEAYASSDARSDHAGFGRFGPVEIPGLHAPGRYRSTSVDHHRSVKTNASDARDDNIPADLVSAEMRPSLDPAFRSRRRVRHSPPPWCESFGARIRTLNHQGGEKLFIIRW
jgi:hypothetical protein